MTDANSRMVLRAKSNLSPLELKWERDFNNSWCKNAIVDFFTAGNPESMRFGLLFLKAI